MKSYFPDMMSAAPLKVNGVNGTAVALRSSEMAIGSVWREVLMGWF